MVERSQLTFIEKLMPPRGTASLLLLHMAGEMFKKPTQSVGSASSAIGINNGQVHLKRSKSSNI